MTGIKIGSRPPRRVEEVYNNPSNANFNAVTKGFTIVPSIIVLVKINNSSTKTNGLINNRAKSVIIN